DEPRSQPRRAAVSVPTTIVEGCARRTPQSGYVAPPEMPGVHPAFPVRGVVVAYGARTRASRNVGRASSGAAHASAAISRCWRSVNEFQLVHQTASACSRETLKLLEASPRS